MALRVPHPPQNSDTLPPPRTRAWIRPPAALLWPECRGYQVTLRLFPKEGSLSPTGNSVFGQRGSANMRVRATIIAVATGLLIASSAYAVNVQEVVRMITHTDLVMSDGTKMHADIVKMHGKMYVMIPVDDLPDYLHQQVLKVMK